MASLGEMIALSRYKSGDMGRANLPTIQRDTPQEQQRKSLVLQSLASELAIRQQQEAIAKRQRELWDSVGLAKYGDKSTRGIATNVVDNEEAGGRDIITVGSSKKPDADSGYEAAISRRGDMYLRPKAEAKPYDRVKVFERAKKIAEQELLMNNFDIKEMKASELSAAIKKYLPQAAEDLEMTLPDMPVTQEQDVITEAPLQFEAGAEPKSQRRTITDLDVKRGALKEMPSALNLGVAKDFYSSKKDKQGASGGKVMIQTPDGKRGYIPQANLQKALQRGAKLVQ